MTPLPPPDYCLFWIDHWAACMQKSEWASWAQAFFSVAAICAAIGIAAWQKHQERLREDIRERAVVERQMAVVTALADYAVNRIGELPDDRSTFDEADLFSQNFDSRVFTSIAEAMQRIGPSDVPHGRVMVQILSIVQTLRDASMFRISRDGNWREGARQAREMKESVDVSRKMLRRMAADI